MAALRSKRGASHQLVRLIGQSHWRLNISAALALEYKDFLKRQSLLHGVGEAQVDDFLDYLFKVANLVPSVSRLRPSLLDPGDELILEVAAQSENNCYSQHERLRCGRAVRRASEDTI